MPGRDYYSKVLDEFKKEPQKFLKNFSDTVRENKLATAGLIGSVVLPTASRLLLDENISISQYHLDKVAHGLFNASSAELISDMGKKYDQSNINISAEVLAYTTLFTAIDEGLYDSKICMGDVTANYTGMLAQQLKFYKDKTLKYFK